MKIILAIIFVLIFNGLLFVGILWSTSPENWYCGTHDSQCERINLYDDCLCYQRALTFEHKYLKMDDN